MKKIGTILLAAVGAMTFGMGIYGLLSTMTKKAAAISIIGSADGPTSVFIAGKVGDGFWCLITVTGGVIVGLSAVLFAFLVRNKK